MVTTLPALTSLDLSWNGLEDECFESKFEN